MSDTLYVYLQEDAAYATRPQQGSGYTSPEVRCYLSELYGQLWDVCYLHKNLQLDVRILYNTTMSGNPRGASMTREEVLLKPEVQVVYYRGNLATQTEKVNQQRLSSVSLFLSVCCSVLLICQASLTLPHHKVPSPSPLAATGHACFNDGLCG